MYYQSSFPEKSTLLKCFGEEQPVYLDRHRRLTFAETPNILSPFTHTDEEETSEELEKFTEVLKGQPIREVVSSDSELNYNVLPRKPHRKPHPRNQFPELPTFHNLHTFNVIKPPRLHHTGYTSLSSVTTNSDSSRYEWMPLDLTAGQRVLYSNTYIVSTETESTMSNRVRGAQESGGNKGAPETRRAQGSGGWRGGMEEEDEDEETYPYDSNDEADYDDYYKSNEANGNQGASNENGNRANDTGMNNEQMRNSIESDDYNENTDNGSNQRSSYEQSNGDASPPPEQRNQQQNASWSDFELTHSNVMGPTLDDLIYWLAPMLGITGRRPSGEASQSGEPAAPVDPPPEPFEMLHGMLGPPPDESILAGLQSFFRMLGLVSPEKNGDDSGEPNMANEKGERPEYQANNNYEVRALTRSSRQRKNGNASDQSRLSDPYIRELVRPAGPSEHDGTSSPDSGRNTPLPGRVQCTLSRPCCEPECRIRHQQQQLKGSRGRKASSASPAATHSGNQQTSFRQIPAATSMRPATASATRPQLQPVYRKLTRMERHVQRSMKLYRKTPPPPPPPPPTPPALSKPPKIRKIERQVEQEPEPYIETPQIEEVYESDEDIPSDIENIEPKRSGSISVYMPPPPHNSPPPSPQKVPPAKPQIEKNKEFPKPPKEEYHPSRQQYFEPPVQRQPPERYIIKEPKPTPHRLTERELKDKISVIDKHDRKSFSKEKKNTKTPLEHKPMISTKPIKEKNIRPPPKKYFATKNTEKRSAATVTKMATKATQSEKYELFPAKESIAEMVPIRESFHEVHRPPPPVPPPVKRTPSTSFIWTPSPESSHHEPSLHEPSFHEPSFHEPPFHEPSFHEPSFHEPSIHEPSFHEPSFHEPSFHEPSFHEPSLHEPSLHEPSIHKPSIHEPSFHEPPLREPPHREPPLREPPLREPPLREPPLREPPLREPPLREPPLREPPVRVPPLRVPPLREPPLRAPPLREPSFHEPSLHEPSLHEPSLHEPSLHKPSFHEPSFHEPPFMDVDPGGGISTVSMEEIIELTSEPELPRIPEKPRSKSKTIREEPVSRKESPCRMIIVCSSEHNRPCGPCCTPYSPYFTPCPTISAIIRHDFRECPGITTSQSKKGIRRPLSEETLTKGSFETKSVERQELLSYICASGCDCTQEGEQCSQYEGVRRKSSLSKSSKTRRGSTDSDRIYSKRTESKESIKSCKTPSESSPSRESSKTETTTNEGSTVEVASQGDYCELDKPASSESILKERGNYRKLQRESSKELKKRRSSGSSQSSMAERRSDRKLRKQNSKELKQRKSCESYSSISEQKSDGKLPKKNSKEPKKKKSSGCIDERKSDGKLPKKKSKELKKQKSSGSSGSCNKPECTSHKDCREKSCPYVKAIRSDSSSKKSLCSYTKMSREEAVRRAWDEINSKACHTRCPCPLVEAATSTPDLSANENQPKETSEKKTSTENTRSVKQKKRKKGSKSSLKSKALPSGCCCNCVCIRGVAPEEPPEMKTMWALTRVNIFEDQSRTYEVMALQPKPSIKIQKTSEVVFVVLPSGETINLPQQGGDSVNTEKK